MDAAEHGSSPLACRLMAELLDRTMDIVDSAAHQRAVQAFLDALKPWLQPGDCPTPRREFTVFSSIEMDWHTDAVSVAFTPEGLAFFRAWRRRRGLDSVMGRSCLGSTLLRAGLLQPVFAHEELEPEFEVILGQDFFNGAVFHLVGQGEGRGQHAAQVGELPV